MKKIIFGAMAAVALLACSKDQVIEQNRANDEIAFSVVADNQTKAQAVYCANNLMNGFKVSGTYNDGTNTNWYFQDDVIEKSGSAWNNTTTTRYWSAGTHNFYAIVNGEMTHGVATAAPTVEGFAPATNVAAQKDLLYAVAIGKTKSASVALNFRHALSQIEFKAKNTNSDLHVEITGVKVGQTPGEGDFAFPTTATDDNFVDHTQATTHTYTTGTWSNQGTPTDYSVSFSEVTVAGNNTAVGLTLSNDNENVANSMLLVPTPATTQWVPGQAFTGKTYLAVKCAIYNVAGTSFDSTTDVCLHNGWAVIPVSFTWEPGKKYIYTFVFGAGNGGYDGGDDPDDPTPGTNPVLSPITYTVTVDDFQKGDYQFDSEDVDTVNDNNDVNMKF